MTVPGSIAVQLEYFQDSSTSAIATDAQSYLLLSAATTVGTNPAWAWVENGAVKDGIYSKGEEFGNNPPGGIPFGNLTIPLTINGAAVPEPASLGLLGIGGLAMLRRRRD